MHGAVADLVGSKGAQHKTGNAAHADSQRAGDGQEDIHGRSDGESDALGPLQRERLWHQFAEDHMQAGDRNEGDGDGDGVSVEGSVGNAADPGLKQAGQNRLAQPAQSQAGNGDAELHSVDDAGELLVELEDDACAGAMRFDELLDTGFADANQREFSRGEESIHRHQQQDDEHPQQHGCNHGILILTF